MASRRQRALPAAGSRAPDFRLARLGGETPGGETSLAETSLEQIVATAPALVVFFKISCPVCQMTLPILERLHASGGLRIYGISQNDAHDTREFMLDFGLTFPTLLDSEDADFPASNDYNISSVPTSFLIERDGTLSRVIEGWQKAEIERLGELAGVVVLRDTDRVPAWKPG